MAAHNSEDAVVITGLTVRSGSGSLLDRCDFRIRKGEIHAVIGESGSGKTTLANFLLGLLDRNLDASWEEFFLFGEKMQGSASGEKWKEWRGKRISLIPQSPASGFHPYRKISSQVLEYFSVLQPELSDRQICLELFKKIGLSDPESAWEAHPHSLSGGERQRILVLLSLYSNAELILADEPTSALDPITGREILDLLSGLVRQKERSLVFISHDLGSVSDFADTISVLKRGRLVETLSRSFSTWAPKTEYARKLFEIDSFPPYSA
ncbi:ABC transporter ATP-binding protein [Leptospira fluminis]|uniref:ABC transporter ATP-binding protein n=1 Tax=Leptospira fluminis TaxID=2484979 RepID=A0A4R9GKT5_9LEPT|nr:ATP-binding cassette domain-containing protein [Leptospira fluminis]TGK14693.1 ABC transporter ATP-binding protein [Leptospira fluminis]